MDQPFATSLTLIRTIKATPEKVFAAWTRPEILKRWMSPREEMAVALAETDLVVGGHYRIVMREPGGKENIVGGTYKEITKDQKLAFTWAWETAPGPETLVTIELRAIPEGTELTMTHANFASAEACDKHNQGWLGCLARLEKHLHS